MSLGHLSLLKRRLSWAQERLISTDIVRNRWLNERGMTNPLAENPSHLTDSRAVPCVAGGQSSVFDLNFGNWVPTQSSRVAPRRPSKYPPRSSPTRRFLSARRPANCAAIIDSAPRPKRNFPSLWPGVKWEAMRTTEKIRSEPLNSRFLNSKDNANV